LFYEFRPKRTEEEEIILNLTEPQTKKLLEYTGPPQINQLALKMALTRLKGKYKSDPTSSTVTQCTTELNAIFDKYAKIMEPDYKWICSI
jgi:hypothetical protein